MSTTINFKRVKSYVKSIDITGIERTDDDYLKKHIGTELFKSTNFEELLEKSADIRSRLLKLGCFKTVDIIVDADQSEKSIKSYKVLIEVEEQGAIGGGIHTSIGNNEGSVSSSLHMPNIFGKGERLSAEYTYGTRNHTDYRMTYTTPIDQNPDKHFSVSGFRSSNDLSWSKYKQNDSGVTVDIMTPFEILFKNKYEIKGTHIVTFEGTWRHLLSYMDSAFEVREQNGHSLKSSIKYTNLIDRRDHLALPTKGGFLKTSAEIAGLGGDVKFFRYNSDYQYTKTILKYFTTQLTFSNGFITPLKSGEKISIIDKFFLGGPLSLRGFTNRGAGPQSEECSLGNDAYWIAGAHLYTPLPFLHKNTKLNWLKTHSFVNIGNILSLNQIKQVINDQNVNNLINNTRLSVGTGLVIGFGNIARLELNYVWPLWKLNSDKVLNGMQFGVGINFN
ncbi:unnamed protein product [Brachionus calyciflorus]|uniref:POTRA domain-containing protein n=1 Tax=Brachionus calyciflorus TaxID=104777 RepID=A0A814NEX1_9BILA|nr:unnamed protein product [Brachionus calyciflorus]